MAALRAATRRSALARAQTGIVAALLDREVEEVLVETTGDRHPEAELWELGRGLFVNEVQAAVLDGRADIAVHSAKDLPSSSAEGLVIAAVPPRDDPRDALVGSTLEHLRVGARVGTSSVRRRAQLAWLRPDLTFAPVRGNVDTRLRKAADFDAIVLAAAGLHRLGRTSAVTELLDPHVVLPQIGQGALAVECRSDDHRVRSMVAAIDDPPSRAAVEAERAYLRELGGGCDRPVGAFATLRRTADGSEVLHLSGVLATGDGRVLLRHAAEGRDPHALGREVARHLIERAGGAMILAETSPS